MKKTLLLLLLLGIARGPSAAAIDPFYRNRMESGVRAYEQGDWDAAGHQLRIACFGYLDEPVLLAEGLVRLAVVEARRGDQDAFRRVFSRLVELEERFSAYTSAAVPPDLDRQFQELAAQLVPAQTLRSVSGFAPVADRAELDQLASLPPEQRRRELAARIEAEPGRTDLTVAMARLELAQRRPQAALDWLDRLPPVAGELPPAICLRQQAASEAGDCERMDLAQPFCQEVPATVVEFRLQCLVDGGRWPEAAGLIGGLGPELRARRRIVRLERRVRKSFDGDLSPATADAAGGEPAAVAPAAAQPAAGVTAPTPPAESAAAAREAVSAEVDRLRRRLEVANSAAQLAALRRGAEALADGDSGSPRAHLLAAEIAYLQSDWPAAVRHFSRAGRLEPTQASLAFYHAVALYETGETAAAARVLRPVASQLQRNEFVDAYVERILGPSG